ncbi:hypothetical protein AZE42_04933 [Rhizopogon vesiculosus]|uniref:Uncharacterized protein n=1 Tax=Rhizopogon vesiculosus TaxID=180088 RepID=A0A1J8QPL7_9AGAM|nr:hypothetical protein AZE42_04933 [Rhizopogon vesiculosus]
MAPETDYYQIGGFRAHSEGWFKMYDDKPMIDAIANDTGRELRPGGRGAPIELILGILPNGASYVLMTSHQMWAFVRKHGLRPPRRPWKVDNFVSLSPIYFATKNDLQEKLKTYRVKSQKNKQDKEDNSQANRGFVRVRGHPENTRGDFENQRVLYRLLTNSVTPGALGLLNPPWANATRVISLVINTWHNDRRPERFEKPHIIDVGWTDVILPEYFGSGRVTETAHLMMKGPLQNKKGDFMHGITEEGVVADILYSRMRTLFTHDAAKSGIPLVVLVHEEEMVRGVLTRSGIDVGSMTSVGALLRSGQLQKSRRKSSRSPSPRRLNAGASHSSRDYERRSKHEPDDDVKPFSVKQDDYRPPSVHINDEDKKPGSSHQDGATALPAACIVNMQTLVRTLMRVDQTGPNVPATALRLNIPANPLLTCAGNECHLLLQMWISIAEGRAIDEQWTDRLAHPLQPPSPTQAPVEGDAEDEIDPNDYLPPPVTNSSRVAAADDDWSDDDW